MNTVQVTTPQLNNGDVLKVWGCVLQLKNRKEHAEGVITFETDCLVYSCNAGMPTHWVYRDGGFIIQGNDRATWLKLVDPESGE